MRVIVNLVSNIHRATDMAPLPIRFEKRVVGRVFPLLKNLKGYHNERVMVE
jgi:hypothetical protein